MSGLHIETLQSPTLYTAAQLDLAARIAYHLGRGRLVLLETPKRPA